MPKNLRPLTIRGSWVVSRSENFDALRSGDRLSFSEEELITRRKGKAEEDEDSEFYQINERPIHLTQTGVVFDYVPQGDRMTLTHKEGGARVYLRRVAEDQGS